MKGLTIVQWINLKWNNRSVLARRYSVLAEETGPILLSLVGLKAGRQVVMQADKIQVEFKILKVLCSLNYSDIFYLLSVRCYYSIKTAFQSALVK